MFTAVEAQTAFEEWGANCGPGALAAMLDRSLEDVRPHLAGFDRKRYTNPRMMRAALDSLGVRYTWSVRHDRAYLPPLRGLARVQWDGPWTKPGVPPAAAYRHTHWVAARPTPIASSPDGSTTQIFDINCMSVGGWVPFRRWALEVVPWIIANLEPKTASGEWWFTHSVEIPS